MDLERRLAKRFYVLDKPIVEWILLLKRTHGEALEDLFSVKLNMKQTSN